MGAGHSAYPEGMWIDTDSSRLPEGVEDELKELDVKRVDRSDHVWLNLETGAAVMLICDGGWRDAPESAFKVFHRNPNNGALHDVTQGMLGRDPVPFDETATGGDTYQFLSTELAKKITALLIPDENRESASQ